MRERTSIIVFSTLLFLPIGAISEPIVNASEEEAVDLDALDDEEVGDAAGSAASEKMLPPGAMSINEIERQPALALIGLLVLVPAIAMFAPAARRRRKRNPFKELWITKQTNERRNYA